MALEIGTTIPEKITAGDTFAVIQDLTNFDPASDTAVLKLVGDNSSHEITGTDNGDDRFLFTATPADTAKYGPGDYRYAILVTTGSDRHTVKSGLLEVKPDPITGGFGGSSTWKRAVEALEATILGRASDDQLQIQIGDRTIAKMDNGQLIQMHEYAKAEYARELQAERVAAGLGSNRKIRVAIR